MNRRDGIGVFTGNMSLSGLEEKILAGLIVALILGTFAYFIRPQITNWWHLLRWHVVRGGGDTGRTFVSAGAGPDGKPDVRVKKQNGDMRILIETQPMGQVVFRFLDPKTGALCGSAIVLSANEPIDFRDYGGAPLPRRSNGR